MSHATHWISRLTAIVFFLNLSACALFAERPGPPTYYGPREQIYYASFDEVWRAVNLVLQPYPLRISNMDQGILETDMIRNDHLWSPPYKRKEDNGGQAYKLTIRVIKGELDGKQATKLTLVKESKLQIDFFSEPRAIPSDGMEEKTILYRVGREIEIERALARAQKKQNDDDVDFDSF